MGKVYKSIKNCRLCGSKDLKEILNLGHQPPSNSLRSNCTDALPLIPLILVRCKNCTTMQLSETVKPEYLFNNYVWVTGTSKTARDYSYTFCNEALKRITKRGVLFVVEVASNDGTFLIPFQKKGHKILGIDPAENIAKIAREHGIQTLTDFFGLNVAEKIVSEYGNADCMFARNVIPHVENIHDVIAGIAMCIGDHGIGAIEFHYSKVILEELHYDSIYHEHLFYYSLHSIQLLLEKHGLFPFDIIESPISGGSLVLYFSKKKRETTSALAKKISIENNAGINSKEKWESFAVQCLHHRKALKGLIDNELKQGSAIIGYGASARSSTLLNFCKINNKHLLCIADQSEIKHNKYTPGTDILIVSPKEAITAYKPKAILLLAWNFKDEIIQTLNEKYQFRGRVIIPLPNESKIIEAV